MSDTILAWHFLPDDGRLRYKPRRRVVVGKTLKVDPDALSMCNYGLHASVKPLDALRYAPGALVCRVELGGKIIEGDDKLCASERTVLWMADASSALRLFACWCVRNTPLGDGRRHWELVADPRSRKVVAVAERYARGKATYDEMEAARDAAYTVSWDVAWAAARDAAREAAYTASLDAAWAAARYAAYTASLDAARASARASAYTASWDAARAAAKAAAYTASLDAARASARASGHTASLDAAWAAQNAQLERMLLKLKPRRNDE